MSVTFLLWFLIQQSEVSEIVLRSVLHFQHIVGAEYVKNYTTINSYRVASGH